MKVSFKIIFKISSSLITMAFVEHLTFPLTGMDSMHGKNVNIAASPTAICSLNCLLARWLSRSIQFNRPASSLIGRLMNQLID